MIELQRVSKLYGRAQALREVSFTAPKGRIVGLLGINGAGKTTALNILTGYFPPTSGRVLVDGRDMLTEPRRCKRMIGFLPERPPLYDEMTVGEYLTFVARLREVAPRAIPAHVREIEGLCGLGDMHGRLLGSLSRGYRQRAGIAQALCGDPPVLVLDEPTVGLDPRQVTEIRALMLELGRSHTIIFSSHLLPEIQQLCSRVVILHHGQVVREADMAELTGEDGTLRLRASIALPERELLPGLRGLACVRRLKTHPSTDPAITEVTLICDPAGGGRGDPYTQLFRLLTALDAPIRQLTPEHETLEEVFLRVTAKE